MSRDYDMKTLQEIYEFSSKLNCTGLLHGLIRDHFKGRTIISASLRARSVVALKLVSEADPATPVVFCHAGPLYPESEEYRDYIIDRFGLTDVRALQAEESNVEVGHKKHVEWIKASTSNGGQIKQAIYLNRTLKDFDCWISAVYHKPRDMKVHHRIDREGHVLRVNPLLNWSDDDIQRFMRAHEIPNHKLAKHEPEIKPPSGNSEPVSTYVY